MDDHFRETETYSFTSKEAFYSSLRNQHISDGDYQHCLDMWQQHNMSTMRDFLVWYNNKNVEPMLQAIDKMFI